MIRKMVVTALAAGLLPLSAANATLEVRDYLTAGDGLITYDSATGLEWLDFSVTVGASVTNALAANAGFTLASREQVAALLGDFGFSHVSFTTTDLSVHPDDLAGATALDQMMGHTISYYGGSITQTFGHVQGSSPGTWADWFFENRYPGVGSVGSENWYIGFANAYSTSISDEASFLVRAGATAPLPTPEPASWLMMVVGFGATGTFLRRRKSALA